MQERNGGGAGSGGRVVSRRPGRVSRCRCSQSFTTITDSCSAPCHGLFSPNHDVCTRDVLILYCPNTVASPDCMMLDLSAKLHCAVARHVCVTALLLARCAGKALLTPIMVPSDDLSRIIGHMASVIGLPPPSARHHPQHVPQIPLGFSPVRGDMVGGFFSSRWAVFPGSTWRLR